MTESQQIMVSTKSIGDMLNDLPLNHDCLPTLNLGSSSSYSSAKKFQKKNLSYDNESMKI